MKKKVLMLGWVFPPVINGGLGVACLGIAKSLSEYVDLTIILPKTDPEFIVENVGLIGLNNIDLKALLQNEKTIKETETSKTAYDSFSETKYININFDP